MEEKRHVTVNVTKADLELIQGILNFHGSDLEIIRNDWNRVSPTNSSDSNDTPITRVMTQFIVPPTSDTQSDSVNIAGETESADRDISEIATNVGMIDDNTVNEDDNEINDDHITPPTVTITANSTECRHCFLDPCVTYNRQSWLPSVPVQPHIRNRALRKTKYKKFWILMQRRGGWNEPRYQRKKERLLRREMHLDDEAWTSYGERRDVMPDCVLDSVREIYPNPPNIPYMGHRWS